MVAAAATHSVRTVALVLAVLAYRRRLRRRDQWSRPALLTYQDRALGGYGSTRIGSRASTKIFTPVCPQRRCQHCPC